MAALAEARLPGLDVEHELVDRRTTFRRLAAGELDLAIVFEHGFEPDPPPDEVELAPLFTDPARVLLPARHPLAGRAVVALQDLAGETWIRAHDGSAARLLDHVLAGDAPVRHVQAALLRDQRAPGPRAPLEVLRELRSG